MSRVLDHGEAGEVLIWLMPAALLAGIGVRSDDWVLVAAVATLVVGFGVVVLVLWLASREPRTVPPERRAEPLAIEAPKPISPLAAGRFVVDAAPVKGGGA